MLMMAERDFSACQKVNKDTGGFEPFAKPWKQTYKDVKKFWSAMNEFGITNMGPDNIFDMSSNLTQSRYDKAWKEVVNQLKNKPEDGRVYIVLCSSYGMNEHGRLCLVMNVFDEKKSHYKLLPVENKVREITSSF